MTLMILVSLLTMYSVFERDNGHTGMKDVLDCHRLHNAEGLEDIRTLAKQITL